MTHRSLERRLAALERHQDAGAGAFVVDTGDDMLAWDGQLIPRDEWTRRYPDAVCVDIGGDGSELVETYRDMGMYER